MEGLVIFIIFLLIIQVILLGIISSLIWGIVKTFNKVHKLIWKILHVW